jgi:hypothetical protein
MFDGVLHNLQSSRLPLIWRITSIENGTAAIQKVNNHFYCLHSSATLHFMFVKFPVMIVYTSGNVFSTALLSFTFKHSYLTLHFHFSQQHLCTIVGSVVYWPSEIVSRPFFVIFSAASYPKIFIVTYVKPMHDFWNYWQADAESIWRMRLCVDLCPISIVVGRTVNVDKSNAQHLLCWCLWKAVMFIPCCLCLHS